MIRVSAGAPCGGNDRHLHTLGFAAQRAGRVSRICGDPERTPQRSIAGVWFSLRRGNFLLAALGVWRAAGFPSVYRDFFAWIRSWRSRHLCGRWEPRPIPSVLLLGTSNSGKTALFNPPTGLNQRVANCPGITVDLSMRRLATLPGLDLVDFPSTSLRERSPKRSGSPWGISIRHSSIQMFNTCSVS